MKVVRREVVFCKVIGVELFKIMGIYFLYYCDLDVRFGVKGDYFGVLRFDCFVGF